jgi:hypothetical protein
VPRLALSTSQIATKKLASLLAGEPVEVFTVGCVSARHRLLACLAHQQDLSLARRRTLRIEPTASLDATR